MKRFNVPALDGLRFFAFFLVFLHHSPSVAPCFSEASAPARIGDFFRTFGWCGVDLFLVLSAFLITTLLLMEWEASGRISLRDFYIRRVLRIWPLYYLMIVIAFLILPALQIFAPSFHDPAYRDMVRHYLLPYATLFGNYAVGIHSYPPAWTLAHMWTITLEEQFYLVWPVLLILLVRKPSARTWQALALLLVLSLGLRWLLVGRTGHPMIWTNTLCRLEPLLAGIALAFYRRGRTLSDSVAFPVLEFVLGCSLVASICLAPGIESQSPHVLWQYAATAIGFALVIDSAVGSTRGPLKWFLSRGPLVWVGRLTYGLYVYHILGIQFANEITQRLGPKSYAETWVISVTLSLALTIAVAALSYYFFEKFFLGLKDRFAHVSSRPVAQSLDDELFGRRNRPGPPVEDGGF